MSDETVNQEEDNEVKVGKETKVKYGTIPLDITQETLENLKFLVKSQLKMTLTPVSYTLYSDKEINSIDDLITAIGESVMNNFIETALSKYLVDFESFDEKQMEKIKELEEMNKK